MVKDLYQSQIICNSVDLELSTHAAELSSPALLFPNIAHACRLQFKQLCDITLKLYSYKTDIYVCMYVYTETKQIFFACKGTVGTYQKIFNTCI